MSFPTTLRQLGAKLKHVVVAMAAITGANAHATFSPEIEAINPTSVCKAPLSNQLLVVNGYHFNAQTVMFLENTALETFYYGPDSIFAVIPKSMLNTNDASVRVRARNKFGQTTLYSDWKHIAIDSTCGAQPPAASAPTITLLNPNTKVAGSAAFQMDITGTNFEVGVKVRWNGTELPAASTVRNSSTSISVQIDAAKVAAYGAYVVDVKNPSSPYSVSNGLVFLVSNPTPVYDVPTLDYLVPMYVTEGDASFSLVINGQGFADGAIAFVNGLPRFTQFVSSTQVVALVDAMDVRYAGEAYVQVANPGTIKSGEKTLYILPKVQSVEAPILKGFNPISVVEGSASLRLCIIAEKINFSTRLFFNGVMHSLSFGEDGVCANIDASLIAQKGIASIILGNPEFGENEVSFAQFCEPTNFVYSLPLPYLITSAPAPEDLPPSFLDFSSSASESGVCVGDTVSFVGNGQSSNGNAVMTFWSFGDGTSASGSYVQHAYKAAGLYTVQAQLVDFGSGKELKQSLSVLVKDCPKPVNQAPNFLSGGIAATPNPAFVGETVLFSPMVSDPEGDALTYKWSLGDGVESTLENPSRLYTVAGDYPITLQVSDGVNKVTATLILKVTDKPVVQPETYPMVLTKGKLKASKPSTKNLDMVDLAGWFDFAPNVGLRNGPVTVSFGSKVVSFETGLRGGSWKSGQHYFRLKGQGYKGQVITEKGHFRLRLRGNFLKEITDAGYPNATIVEIPVTVSYGGRTYSTSARIQLTTSKSGKTIKGKAILFNAN